MPELPDVEGFRAVLDEHGRGRRIKDVEVLDASVVRDMSGRAFVRAVRGGRFGEPRRHGKWLLTPIEDGPSGDRRTLAAHFGMTGELLWCADGEPRHRHDRVVFTESGGELRYRDMRKLKGLRLTDDDGVARLLEPLGPDACAVTAGELGERLAGTRRYVKTALTDQSVVAGLGNLLADEICWRARLDPRRRSDGLDRDEVRRLHARMRSVLRAAIPTGRVPGRKSWLTGHRDEDPGACPRCGTSLRHSRIGGRATVCCPHCQPAE